MVKREILNIIYDRYEKWSQQFSVACSRGCNACCTCNVTITAQEGEEILSYIRENGREQWLAKRLTAVSDEFSRPAITTNGFARACMEDRDVELEDNQTLSACPFLEDGLCGIYPVRPFGCRLFVSTAVCSKGTPAVMPQSYLGSVTAVSQIIEHLGQKEYWGNMLDVLPALMDISINSDIARHLNTEDCNQARLKTLTAEPLPGLLLDEQEAKLAGPLLREIFSAQVDGRTVEDILNGK